MPFPALEVRRAVETEGCGEGRELPFVELGAGRVRGPEVEAALLPLGVRVEGGVEAALRPLHLADRPAGGLAGGPLEEVLAPGPEPGRLGAEGEERPVVVQHLLEVRDHPFAVHRVAAEPAPEMVVDPAEGHPREGVHAHVQVARVAVAAEAALDVRGMRKLRRAPEPAVAGVEGAAEARHRPLQGLGAEGGGAAAASPARLRAGEGLAQRLVLLRHVAPVGGEEVHDAMEQIAERGETVARRRREVGPAEEGGQVVGGQEHRERPAAGAAREQLVRDLVDLVEVRALLAVHLDVDEVFVHHPRGGLVLEGLVGHDVAPVAGGIADGEEDGPALPPRAVEGFRPPRVPVHRVVRVLEEVGAGLGGQTVPAGGWRGHVLLPGRGRIGAGRRRPGPSVPEGWVRAVRTGGRGPRVRGRPRGSVAYNPDP